MSTTYDIGKVACTPKGAHIQANTYEKLDIVTYGGETYMAVQNVPANITIDNTTYWLKLVVKGAKGDTGDAAGFGTPTITASGLPAGSAPTATITASGLDTAKIFAFALGIPKGDTGATGKGITSIAKTSTAGLVDTYTITYTDSTTSTFTVTNGTSELESTTGQSTVKGMTQKAISDELSALNEDITQLETDLAAQTRINTKQSREIANLRQQAPADTVVNYPDTTYGKGEVPTSVCKYAEVNKISGCSRVWNQILPNGNFASISGWFGNMCDLSVANNKCTCTITYKNINTSIYQYFSAVASHKYLISVLVKSSEASDSVNFNLCGNFGTDTSVQANQETIVSSIITVTSNYYGELYTYFNREEGLSIGTTVELKNFMLIDLTLLYGSGSEPTTVAQFKADYPLPYYAYNAGEIKSSTLTAFNSKGVNILDGDAFADTIVSVASGVKDTSNKTVAYAARDISGQTIFEYPFKANTRYTIWYNNTGNAANIGLLYTDGTTYSLANSSGVHSHYVSEANKTLKSIVGVWTSGQTVLYYNSLAIIEGVDKAYVPYSITTTSLPQAITLKSAGTAKDEYVPSTGAVTRNIGMVDLGSLNWSYASGEHARFYTTLSGSVNVGISIVPNMVCQKYNTTNYDILYNHTQDKVISHFPSDGIIAVYDSAYSDAPTFKTAMNGVILYYELATPTSESVTPIDDFIEVEAEGEMSLTHTESPAMDSRFTVTYANLS